MNDKSSASSGGISFSSLLFLFFLVLKLTHYIDWSWWWVTAPLWIPVTIALTILLVCFCLAAIAVLVGLLVGKK